MPRVPKLKRAAKTGGTSQPSPLLSQVGGLVRWYANGWRNGRLIEVGRIWAKVLYCNRIKKVLIKEVNLYDPHNKPSA